MIPPDFQAELYRFIGSVVERREGKLLAAGGMPDHVHLLVGWKPALSVSDMLRTIKATSSKWVRDHSSAPGEFAWQTGYGAFSVSKSAVPGVRAYIANQEAHHRKMTSAEELVLLLRRHGVPCDPKALLE